MKKLNFVLLAVANNDYQTQQVNSARAAAQKLDVELQVIHTEHDSILQSQQVLEFLQAPAGRRPDAIFFEPVGTALAQPARAAAANGVGWVVLNRENVEYMAELRQTSRVPMFCATTSHRNVGQIQGEQVKRLLPNGGVMLLIEGPSDNEASVRRAEAMHMAKPGAVEVRTLRGRWTEQSAYSSVSAWLKLSISKELPIALVAAQNDAMALGAHKAFDELPAGPVRDRWRNVPLIGCDGLPNGGQKAVRGGQLTATVVIPPNAGTPVELMATSIQQGTVPAEVNYSQSSSFPPLEALRPLVMKH
jgi:ABC-type sugar transport system substrate-binding protein